MPDSPIELATGLLQSTVSVLVGAAGVMISFVWGFIALHPAESTSTVKWATAFLVVAIVFGMMSLQFAISSVSRSSGPANPTKSTPVAVSFAVAWVAFILGAGLLAASIPGGI
jgi:hypothetical protein